MTVRNIEIPVAAAKETTDIGLLGGPTDTVNIPTTRVFAVDGKFYVDPELAERAAREMATERNGVVKIWYCSVPMEKFSLISGRYPQKEQKEEEESAAA